MSTFKVTQSDSRPELYQESLGRTEEYQENLPTAKILRILQAGYSHIWVGNIKTCHYTSIFL